MLPLPPAERTLLGRDAHLARLAALVDLARDGRGAALLLVGEPGAGKTVLTDRAAELAGDFLVLRCGGMESELELPYSGLHELLLPLLPMCDEIEPRLRTALLAALAVHEGQMPEAIEVSMATLTLLTRTAGARPLLVIVDDLQWVDAATARTLAFVARRLRYDPVLLLLASRPPIGTEHAQIERMEVGPLSRSEAGELAQRCVDRPLVGAARSAIANATGGNPLAVIETTRMARDDLDRLGSVLDAPLAPTDLIKVAFASRLADLPPETRDALLVVAASLASEAGSIDDALGELGLDESALDPAEAAGLLIRGVSGIAFTHPLLRSLSYYEASAADRRRAHAALAATAKLPASRAWHAGAASPGPDETVAAELERAAEGFQQRGGSLAAARALERSARLSVDPDLRARRLFQAGRAAQAAARFSWAEELLDEARSQVADESLRLRIDVLRAGVASRSAEPSWQRFMHLAGVAMAVDGSIALDALARGASEAILAGEAEVALEAASQLLEHSTPDDTHSRGIAGTILTLTGADPARGDALLIEVSSYRGEPRGSEAVVAEALVWAEQFALAEALTAGSLTHLRDAGHMHALIAAMSVDGYRRFRIGEWNAAEAALDQVVHLTDLSDQRWEHCLSTAMLGTVRAARGDTSARELLRVADDLALEAGYPDLEPYLASALGLLDLALGEPRTAIRHLERAEAWCLQAGHAEPGIHSWPADLVEAYAGAGQVAQASAALERLRERAERHDRTLARAQVARLDGLLAADADFTTHFDRALELHAQVPVPFELARTRFLYGRRLRRAGLRRRAQEQLTTAARAFDRIGSAGWLRQAESELRATGAPGPERIATVDRPTLTSQESAVADLVAEGLTNKEIAARLFLTPKTIEWHLRQIYRKLEIKSRVQLAAHVKGQ